MLKAKGANIVVDIRHHNFVVFEARAVQLIVKVQARRAGRDNFVLDLS